MYSSTAFSLIWFMCVIWQEEDVLGIEASDSDEEYDDECEEV